jgi:protein SCO1
MNQTILRLGLLLGLLAAAGCGPTSEPAPASHEHPAKAHTHERHGTHAGHEHHANGLATEVGVLTDHSIYHLESEWWNQHGEVQPLEGLAGRVQVISMAYTHCSYACPRILMDMKRIEGQLGDPERLGFVLVSIDPERDTPDRLRDFAESTRLGAEAWTLLGGSDGDILELATLLGIRFRAEGEGEFAHSNTILVLNPSGEIVYRQLGLGEDLTPMLDAIRKALPDPKPLASG